VQIIEILNSRPADVVDFKTQLKERTLEHQGDPPLQVSELFDSIDGHLEEHSRPDRRARQAARRCSNWNGTAGGR